MSAIGTPAAAGAAACVAAAGAGLLWSAFAPSRPYRRRRPLWLRRQRGGLAGASAVLFVITAALAYAMFDGLPAALLSGCFAATFPAASARARAARERAAARAAWPRMLEEMRVLTGSLGRSVPQALFEAGRRAPGAMRPGFAAAEREWLVSTDFHRTVAVLKEELRDPTADACAETLLVAHEIGGSGLDRRLAALAEDRAADLRGRRDAEARQAGVRFARRFVLVVPAGMALAGLSIGTGRSAYESAGGQAAVAVGILAVVACWAWAGRLMRLPDTERVLQGAGDAHRPPQAAQ